MISSSNNSFSRSVILTILVIISVYTSLATAATDDSTDDFTYSNPDDTYAPSDFVKYGHRLTNEDFSATTEYLQRVLYSPIVIAGLGFLALLALLTALLFRCCCEGCKCKPDPSSDHYKKDQFSNTVIFYLLCLLVLVIDQLVFMGNTEIDSGISTFNDALHTTENIVTDIQNNGTVLTQLGGTLTFNYNDLDTSCSLSSNSAFSDVKDYLITYNDSISIFTDIVAPLSGNFDTVSGYMDQYAGFYRTIALYVIWALAMVAVFFFIIAKCCSSLCMMQFSIFFAVCVYLLYLLLGIPWVITTSLGADLCMAPSYNVIKSLPGDSLRNLTTYYSTCEGASTINNAVTSGVSALLELNSSLATLRQSGYCPQVSYITAMQDTTGDVVLALEVIRDKTLACERFQNLWFEILNTGLCEELYTGIFYIWGSQLVTSFLLFVLIIVSTFTYQYFDQISGSGKKGSKVAPGEDKIDDGNYELVEEDDHHHGHGHGAQGHHANPAGGHGHGHHDDGHHGGYGGYGGHHHDDGHVIAVVEHVEVGKHI